MVARARRPNENFKKYRKNLKKEALALKRFKAGYWLWVANKIININGSTLAPDYKVSVGTSYNHKLHGLLKDRDGNPRCLK